VEKFEEFQKGKVHVYRLNFVVITIIPKEKYTRTHNKFTH
jgi:hypothetical protein